jgi:VanZ family protein
MIQILKFWKSIITTFVICYLSFAQPDTFKNVPKLHIDDLDKIIHMIMYFGLTTILWYDYGKIVKHRTEKSLIITGVVFPILLGGFIEIAQQAWFSPRTAEWADWSMDAIGTLLAFSILAIAHHIKHKDND